MEYRDTLKQRWRVDSEVDRVARSVFSLTFINTPHLDPPMILISYIIQQDSTPAQISPSDEQTQKHYVGSQACQGRTTEKAHPFRRKQTKTRKKEAGHCGTGLVSFFVVGFSSQILGQKYNCNVTWIMNNHARYRTWSMYLLLLPYSNTSCLISTEMPLRKEVDAPCQSSSTCGRLHQMLFNDVFDFWIDFDQFIDQVVLIEFSFQPTGPDAKKKKEKKESKHDPPIVYFGRIPPFR